MAGLRCNKGVTDFLHTLPYIKSLRVLGSFSGSKGGPDGGCSSNQRGQLSIKRGRVPRGIEESRQRTRDLICIAFVYTNKSHTRFLPPTLLLSHLKYIVLSRAVLRPLILSAPLTRMMNSMALHEPKCHLPNVFN